MAVAILFISWKRADTFIVTKHYSVCSETMPSLTVKIHVTYDFDDPLIGILNSTLFVRK